MTAMLRSLVGDVAAELRAALSSPSGTAKDDEAALVAALARAGLLNSGDLIALLLRRADEERVGAAARSRTGHGNGRAIQGLVSHANAEVSAAAMGVVLARGRRRDRFGQLFLTFDDVPQEAAEALAYAIAAALRSGVAATEGAAADSKLTGAASALLERHDPARSLDRLTAALVAALERSGTLNDELLLAAAREGEVGFLALTIAARACIDGNVAFDELLSGNATRFVTVLRLAECSRQLSAALLATLGDLIGIDEPETAIELFESLTGEDLEKAMSWLASPVGYRAALNALGGANG
jgi:hypothetical protein